MHTEGQCWRIVNPCLDHEVDRIRFQNGDFVRIGKHGNVMKRNMSAAIYEACIAQGKIVPCKDEPMPPEDVLKNDVEALIRKYGFEEVYKTVNKSRNLPKTSIPA